MLVIGNKKYRNLQEQVGWNTEQIEKIFEFLDGINVSDNVVVVTDISTPLTTEELEIVNREVAFIVYNGELYFKKNQDASYIYFDIVFKVSGSTVITLASSEITVTKSNGALGIANSSVSTYSKSEVDSLLSAKADITYVSSNYAALSGATFTGAITAPSIIENMSGYSFDQQTSTKAVLTYVYAGAVKNGNKLTLVLAYIVNRNVGQSGGMTTGRFMIPSDIMAKVYPFIGANLVDAKYIDAWKDSVNSKSLRVGVIKYDNNSLYFNIGELSVLDESTDYYVRQEITLLLSDNLAS